MELVELVPDVDINPIGCISGKAAVIKARSYAEVRPKRRVVCRLSSAV